MNNDLVLYDDDREMRYSLVDVKRQFAPNATDNEFYFFCQIAKLHNVNPFKREVHFIKYGNSPGETVVGYQAYLKRGEQSGKLDGWNVSIGHDDFGEKATITIKRKDMVDPVVWEVYRNEVDTKKSTWNKMPLFMLRKVAIAQGFRLAFPTDAGGLPYIAEEITENNLGALATQPPKQTNMATRDQIKKLFAISNSQGISPDDMRNWVEQKTGKNSTKDLTKSEISGLIDVLQNAPPIELEVIYESDPEPVQSPNTNVEMAARDDLVVLVQLCDQLDMEFESVCHERGLNPHKMSMDNVSELGDELRRLIDAAAQQI